MNKNIYPCLWFNGQAKEAAELYCSLFKDSKISTDTPMVVLFEIAGLKVMGLNGGPMFKINPSISLFIMSDSDEEISKIWEKLSEGGKVMMELDKYPWSEKYGWVADKYGMTWQIMKDTSQGGGQKIIPSFLFVDSLFGKAKEAIEMYTSLLPGSRIELQEFYPEGDPQLAGKLMFGHFVLMDQLFAAMDGLGSHNFTFSEGVSIVVECDTQEEIDRYWKKLTEGGEESMCGWLKDKYGVSWQIIPKVLGKLMSDPEKGGRVMQEIMKMKKLDIAKLENA